MTIIILVEPINFHVNEEGNIILSYRNKVYRIDGSDNYLYSVLQFFKDNNPCRLDTFLQYCQTIFISTSCSYDILHYLEHLGLIRISNQKTSIEHTLTDDHYFFENQLPFRGKPNMAIDSIFPERRSGRKFKFKKTSKETLLRIIGQSYGVDKRNKKRMVPSAGGVYGIEFRCVMRTETNIKTMLIDPINQKVLSLNECNRADLDFEKIFYSKQIDFDSASYIVFLCSKLSAYTDRYGKRGYRYALIEAGHIAQNLILFTSSLDLLSVPCGAHFENSTKNFLNIDASHSVLYAIIIGSGNE